MNNNFKNYEYFTPNICNMLPKQTINCEENSSVLKLMDGCIFKDLGGNSRNIFS
jgi:hypothetical protein